MRGYLLLLVFSVAIPAAVFAAILLQRYYNSEVARIDQQLLNNARQLALTVDRDLAGLQATLQTLALSRVPRNRRSRSVLPPGDPGA